MQRIIEVDGVCSKAVRATISIVPGDSNADLLMCLCMLSAVDRVVNKNPSTNPALLADDVQMLVIGKEDDCSRDLAAARKQLADELEGVCKLTVSTEKLALVASVPKVAKEIIRRYSRLKGACKRPVRNLGVDYSSGGVICRTVQNARFAKMKPNGSSC